MAAGLVCLASPALAEQAGCAPREVVVARLAEVYGETRRSVGLASAQAMVEIFASDSSGSWTITVTRPGGLTCLIASGRGFEALAEGRPAPGEDA